MNWGDIKEAVREYTHRSDITDALMNTFLAFAEQRIHFGEVNTPKLRCSAMLCAVTMYYGTRPSDFLEAVKIYPVDKPDEPLDYAPIGITARSCNAFTWNGQELVLSQDMAFPVEMLYYAKLPTLTADTDCNWVTDNAPSIYITAIGVEAGDWMRDAAFASSQASKYTSACASLVSSDKAAYSSGSPLMIRRRP